MPTPPPRGEYVPVDYRHVRSGPLFRAIWEFAGALTWPVTVPLALLSRTSIFVFLTISEMLSVVPYAFGLIVRAQFYRFALRRCGRNVVINFGTVFNYRDITIGDNVLIGRYNVIHHCDFGDFVLTGEHCVFLSGSRQHSYDRDDLPIYLQGGQRKHIAVGSDVWVSAHCVVAEDVGSGSIVAAGAFVNRPVPQNAIAIGSPARTRPRFRSPAAPAATEG